MRFSKERMLEDRALIKKIIIREPTATLHKIKDILYKNGVDLEIPYINKHTRAIRKERLERLDKQQVKPEISALEDTINEVSGKMWGILQDVDAGYNSKILAAQTLVRNQVKLLEIKISTGIFEGVNPDSLSKDKQLDNETKQIIFNVFNNWGIIKKDDIKRADIIESKKIRGHIRQPASKKRD